MAQRLGIAAALLGDPSVLLLDEPVNGLDPEGVVWIRNLLKGLAAEGRTVFVSSHLMSEMALTADHLIVIARGRLLADTTVRDFIEANSRSYVRIRTPEPERMRDTLASAGIRVKQAPDGALEAYETEAARIGELAAANNLTVHEVSAQSASLEEAFMRLTGDAAEYVARGPQR
jgi:ABC-2 type transport system ATP-binding protein